MIKICIETAGAAFEDSMAGEVKRILEKIISTGLVDEAIYNFNMNQKRKLMDIYGNSTGFLQIKAGYCENED